MRLAGTVRPKSLSSFLQILSLISAFNQRSNKDWRREIPILANVQSTVNNTIQEKAFEWQFSPSHHFAMNGTILWDDVNTTLKMLEKTKQG